MGIYMTQDRLELIIIDAVEGYEKHCTFILIFVHARNSHNKRKTVCNIRKINEIKVKI